MSIDCMCCDCIDKMNIFYTMHAELRRVDFHLLGKIQVYAARNMHTNVYVYSHVFVACLCLLAWVARHCSANKFDKSCRFAVDLTVIYLQLRICCFALAISFSVH